MAPTTFVARPVRDEIVRADVLRFAGSVVAQALGSGNPRVVEAGRFLQELLLDEAHDHEVMFGAGDVDFGLWSRNQSEALRLIRAEAGSLSGLISWRIKPAT